MGGSVSSHQRQLHLGLLVVTAIVMLILRAYARDMVSWLAHVPEINYCGDDVACYRHVAEQLLVLLSSIWWPGATTSHFRQRKTA